MLTLENLIEYTKEFGKKHISPITDIVDKEGKFPKEVFDALRSDGYMGLLVPKNYGGIGGDVLDYANVCYTLAQFDATTALCYMMHTGGVLCICNFGSEWLKNEMLPKIARGEIVIAIAYRESGYHLGLEIKETKKDGKRILNGRKSFVSLGEYADVYLTYTNSCIIKGGKNNWIVNSRDKNLLHEHGVWDGMGMRGNASIPVQYNNVELDEKWLVGKEGDGSNQTDYTGMYGIIGFGAVYSGLAKASFDCILEHTKNRKYSDGQRLCDIESIRIKLAEIYTKVQSAISFINDCARSFKNKEEGYSQKIFASKVHVTQTVIEVCTLAMKLGGGIAYSKKLPLERYMRDSLASQVMAPTPESVLEWLSNELMQD